MKQTVRQFLKDMTPEEANSLLGHKTKQQVAKWLAHGQLPFKAADKIMEAIFFAELANEPTREVAPETIEEQAEPEPQFTPEQLHVMELERQLDDARLAASGHPVPQTAGKLTWADVAKAGAIRPVVAGSANQPEPPREIAPGVLEIDPAEQSSQSMTLPGRVLAATNLPPRPIATKPAGPINITPQHANQNGSPTQVPVQPVPAPRPVAPQNQHGWVKGPTTPTQQKGWTTPAPRPAKANG